MLEITGKDIVKFLITKDGKLAEWWLNKMVATKSHEEAIKIKHWGILISPVLGTNEQKYWIDFLPLRQAHHWQGKYLRVLVRLLD